MLQFINNLKNMLFRKTENEIYLSNHLKALESMQIKLALYESEISMWVHLAESIPEEVLHDFEERFKYLCNGDIHSENYHLVIKSMIDIYKVKYPILTKKLDIFLENYSKMFKS